MKNRILILIVVAIIIIVGFIVYVLSKNSSESNLMMKKNKGIVVKEETFIDPTGVMMEKDKSDDDNMMDNKMDGSRYVQYSKTAFASAAGNRRVLFFYASWCPICKPADINFTQNVSKIPKDVILIRVNYNDPDTDNEEKELAKKYGITYQHTFVQIDGAGKEIAKWNGGQIDELLSNVK